MKKLRSCFVIALLLSLAALIFTACGKKLPQEIAPTHVYIDENYMLYWQHVSGNTAFVVEIEGETYETDAHEFDLFPLLLEEKVYSIRLKAKGDVKTTSDSAWVDCNYTLDYEYEMAHITFNKTSDGYGYTAVFEKSEIGLTKPKIFVPAEYNGEPVVRIAGWAIEGNTTLTGFRMADGVTELPAGFFEGCTALTHVRLSQNLDMIYYDTFRDCTALKEISVPDSVELVGKNAFKGTRWFEEHPDGPVYAGRVLYKYKGIAPPDTVLTVREGTVSVTPYAIYSDKSIPIPNNIIKIVLPDGLRVIGAGAFGDCRQTTEIILPQGLAVIEDFAFYWCPVTALTIPKSVRYIDEAALPETLHTVLFEDPTNWQRDYPRGETFIMLHDWDLYREVFWEKLPSGQEIPIETAATPTLAARLFDRLKNPPYNDRPRLYKKIV